MDTVNTIQTGLGELAVFLHPEVSTDPESPITIRQDDGAITVSAADGVTLAGLLEAWGKAATLEAQDGQVSAFVDTADPDGTFCILQGVRSVLLSEAEARELARLLRAIGDRPRAH